MSDPRQRRALLVTVDNPRRTLDLLVAQQVFVRPHGIALRYVPDQLLWEPAESAAYVEALADLPLTELAITVFEDLASELVPRWLALRAGTGDDAVVLQETRRTWSNPELLACVRPW